ncbi:MAG: protein translocase subunit SecD [Brachymonas sp.]|nr:protein translocase subunit SecD [Brachymonas sp.]MDO4794436.1 protein translocase subunit SecD [Brachymonas sp.]
MNRYPLWKYITMFVVVLLAAIYALPNYFGEAPAVQISPSRATAAIDEALKQRALTALAAAQLQPTLVEQQGNSLVLSFDGTDTQIKARDVVDTAVNPQADEPDYSVALNLVSRSPQWLRALRASPMFLGLDLRGGVHFTLQVDTQEALSKRLDALALDARNQLAQKNIAVADVKRTENGFVMAFADEVTLDTAQPVLQDGTPELQWMRGGEQTTAKHSLTATFSPAEATRFQEAAVKQNILTLNNRINELGVAEPVIQQQGSDRVVVQLPGVQDTAKAKEILGRTATLEIRLVDESPQAHQAEQDRNLGKPESEQAAVPFGSEVFFARADAHGQRPVYILKKEVLLTGNNLTNANTGFDHQTHAPTVNLELDSSGARDFQTITRENRGRRLAILLFEKGKGEVVTAPVINDEIPGGRVQITGSRSTQEAADTALLLRSGSLAAPMDIVEERTIGPGLGAANIDKGFKSVVYGFVAVVLFMCVYYMLFGVISSIALGVNLLMLVAVLSMLQATLTLPGIAAMALTLGMAIDANVLINERIREELRAGVSPQAAIHSGYEHAWATILDSNLTSLIAGIALLAFGSGPVRGFAVVHCLGILTSMFSAVFFSRGLVNLWYGRRKVKELSIGSVWRPEKEAKLPHHANTNASSKD